MNIPKSLTPAQEPQHKAAVEQAKPLPSAIVKEQNAALEKVGIAQSIDADLAEFEKKLEAGGLELGPFENLASRAKNFSGMSDENSRAFASFKSTLEKQRNDSLRLNNGVQTEGDAQRAWNELFASINDPVLVKQRIGEIRKINQRGAELQKLRVDRMRNEYGKGPMDFSQFKTESAISNEGGTQAAPTLPETIPDTSVNNYDDVLQRAQDAMARGANKDAVIQRLMDAGYTPDQIGSIMQ